MKVTIKQPDLSKWIDTINDLTTETGTAIQETAVLNAPRKTGVYQRSIEYDGAYTVIANAHYSAAVEYGIKNPAEIKPVTAKALHFTWQGKEVFFKKVKQKQTQPNPVMRKAARTVQKQIPQLFKEAQRKNGL
jgi:hypothetical protein